MSTKVDHKDAQSAQKFYSDCLHALTQNNTPSFFEFLNKYRSETSETLQNIFQSYQSEGKTFFHIAASTRNTDVIRYALENCSNASILVNTADEHGFTPLINATVGESSDIMKLLILHGANVNSQNNDGASALHFASGDGSIERMNILCDAGADVSLTSQAGSPLSWAAGNGRAEAVRFLARIGCSTEVIGGMGIPAIFMAAVAPSEETVVALVESGADVGHIVSGNLTVLHICAEHGMCDAVSAIVSTETGKRTAEVENSDGNKPLHLAAMGSHEAIIRILAPYSGSLPSVYFVGGVLGADLCMDAILSDGKLRLDEWMSTHRSSNQPKESKMEADTAAMNSDVNGEPVDLTSPVTAEKISESEEHKARGNKHFNAGRFEEAASAYSEAINSNPLNHTLWSNRSACYLSQVDAIVQSQSAAPSSSFLSPSSSVVQELKEKALKDAEICRRIKPDWPKGCFRLASARLALDMFEEAAVAAYEGCQLDDNSLELKSLLKKAVKMGQEQYRKSQEQNNKSK